MAQCKKCRQQIGPTEIENRLNLLEKMAADIKGDVALCVFSEKDIATIKRNLGIK